MRSKSFFVRFLFFVSVFISFFHISSVAEHSKATTSFFLTKSKSKSFKQGARAHEIQIKKVALKALVPFIQNSSVRASDYSKVTINYDTKRVFFRGKEYPFLQKPSCFYEIFPKNVKWTCIATLFSDESGAKKLQTFERPIVFTLTPRKKITRLVPFSTPKIQTKTKMVLRDIYGNKIAQSTTSPVLSSPVVVRKKRKETRSFRNIVSHYFGDDAFAYKKVQLGAFFHVSDSEWINKYITTIFNHGRNENTLNFSLRPGYSIGLLSRVGKQYFFGLGFHYQSISSVNSTFNRTENPFFGKPEYNYFKENLENPLTSVYDDRVNANFSYTGIVFKIGLSKFILNPEFGFKVVSGNTKILLANYFPKTAERIILQSEFFGLMAGAHIGKGKIRPVFHLQHTFAYTSREQQEVSIDSETTISIKRDQAQSTSFIIGVQIFFK